MSAANKIITFVEKQGTAAPQMCFAIPGYTLIDFMLPNGKSACFGHDLEQVQARYPGAQVMTFDDYQQSKAAAQDVAVVWIETTQTEYDAMLGCLPPAYHTSGGFLVGEPFDHHVVTGEPRYEGFRHVVTRGYGWREDRFFRSSRPMTVREFKESNT